MWTPCENFEIFSTKNYWVTFVQTKSVTIVPGLQGRFYNELLPGRGPLPFISNLPLLAQSLACIHLPLRDPQVFIVTPHFTSVYLKLSIFICPPPIFRSQHLFSCTQSRLITSYFPFIEISLSNTVSCISILFRMQKHVNKRQLTQFWTAQLKLSELKRLYNT